MNDKPRKLNSIMTFGVLIGSFTAIVGWFQFQNKIDFIPLDTQFKIIDGRTIILKQLKNKTILVNFWATTCGVCLRDIPKLSEIYHELKSQGVEFIGVAMPYDPPNRVLDAQNNYNINYPIALDIDGTLTRIFGNVSTTPTHFLISDGAIIRKTIGSIKTEDLRKELNELLFDKTHTRS